MVKVERRLDDDEVGRRSDEPEIGESEKITTMRLDDDGDEDELQVLRRSSFMVVGDEKIKVAGWSETAPEKMTVVKKVAGG
ncbi:hypothetical protein Hanom_Chr16g01489681 [Helianthus anomalus]